MLKISFDFDEVSKKVSNVTVTESSVIKDFDLKVEDNKIQLGFNAIQKLGVEAGDRISVNYWTVDNETTYPIISKSDVFTDGSDGQKLTKKGTFSFKGQQRTSLLKFGDLFTFSEFKDKNGEVKDNVFILTPIDSSEITEVKEDFADEKDAISDLNNTAVEEDMVEILNDDFDALPF